MEQSWAVIISQNGASSENGHTDLDQLLTMLDGVESPPVKLFFTTEGVSLVAHGSPILSELKRLEANGVEMVACRTCLDYMGLRGSVQVGHISAMDHILDSMEHAGSVVVL
jgi:intracellular sulfur oxidation DsrE/DsrF family protein